MGQDFLVICMILRMMLGPDDYYAVIPYRDINKLFDLLNKHVRYMSGAHVSSE